MSRKSLRARAVALHPLLCTATMLAVSMVLATSLGWSRRSIHLGERTGLGKITVRPPLGWTDVPTVPIGTGPARRFDSPNRASNIRILLVEQLGPAQGAAPVRLAKFVIDSLFRGGAAFPDLLPLAERPVRRALGPVEGVRALDVSGRIAALAGTIDGEGYYVAMIASSPLAPRDFLALDAVAASIEVARR